MLVGTLASRHKLVHDGSWKLSFGVPHLSVSSLVLHEIYQPYLRVGGFSLQIGLLGECHFPHDQS